MRNMPDDVIDVWAVSARDFVPSSVAWCIIGSDEQARASRLRTAPAREGFVCGHATMRTILSDYVQRPAEELRFKRGQYGKPILPDTPDLHFNLSHTDAYWLLAVSCVGPVGVDVEKIRVDLNWHEPAHIAFHPREVQYVERNSGSERRRFFEVWTRKEAMFKGMGIGLHNDMARTSLVDETGVLGISVQMQDGACWHIHELGVAEGYVAAMATRDAAMRIQTRTFAACSLFIGQRIDFQHPESHPCHSPQEIVT